MTEVEKKAIDLTVDSLKLYITLSTILIAGLLGVYNADAQKVRAISDFYWSVSLLLVCAITCIVIINYFINEIHFDKGSTRKGFPRTLNFFAIALFFVGIIMGGIYVISGQGIQQSTVSDGIITITTDKVEVKGKIADSVKVITDSVSKFRTIYVLPVR